jgi:uncharacterized protein YfeS
MPNPFKLLINMFSPNSVHPAAKKILDDPFFWDIIDGYSPHGNDDGADTMAKFQQWRKKNAGVSSRTFLSDLFTGWGIYDAGTPPDLAQDMMRNATIGLAFAHLKLEGACPRWVKEETLSLLQKEQERMAKDVVTYKDRITCYSKMEQALKLASVSD